jgi:predicted murein hydrolase (TIGR00659 family)
MKEFLSNSIFFGAVLSISGYVVGISLKRRFKQAIFNPLLISIIFVIIVLILFRVDYERYYTGAKYLNYLLTPATVCLAIPLYRQLELLKGNIKAIAIGIVSGVFSSLGSILILSLLFRLTHQQYVTLLPKSITTAIGIEVSKELGGNTAITAAIIILSGIVGNLLAETICKVFHIKEPIAKGVAIGTSSHVIGTAKAMEMGEIEGAMSSLAVVVAGIITVALAIGFSGFIK